MLTTSYIEFSGWIVEGQIDGFKKYYSSIYFPHYNETFVEHAGVIIEKGLSLVDTDHTLKLALKYENEAIYDNSKEFSLLKRWSALEFIADSYLKLSPQKKKEKVRKLIKEIKYSTPILKDNGDKDILDIVYCYRNCIVHSGSCNKISQSSKKCEQYCKNSKYSIDELNYFLREIIVSFVFISLGLNCEFRNISEK